jgi:type I restriction enzyme M protein
MQKARRAVNSTRHVPLYELLVAMLEPYKGRVYDPCCGSGGMFVQSEKFIAGASRTKLNDVSILWTGK